MSAYAAKSKSNIDWGGEVIEPLLGFAIIGAFLYLVIGCLVQLGVPTRVTHYSAADYLRAEGLNVHKTYHLRLGAATGGGSIGKFTSSATTDFFLFAGSTTLTTSGQITPTSTLRLGYGAKGASYILEIPYSEVQFKPVKGARDTVKFVIYNSHNVGKFVQKNVGKHFWDYERGHPAATPLPDIYKTATWREVRRVGLPTYLVRHLTRVVFTLTPQQYSAYLGTLQTAKG